MLNYECSYCIFKVLSDCLAGKYFKGFYFSNHPFTYMSKEHILDGFNRLSLSDRSIRCWLFFCCKGCHNILAFASLFQMPIICLYIYTNVYSPIPKVLELQGQFFCFCNTQKIFGFETKEIMTQIMNFSVRLLIFIVWCVNLDPGSSDGRPHNL